MFWTLFLVGLGVTLAQTQVRGTIVDIENEPVIGATVQIKGTSQGTITDYDGNFSLSAPTNGTLVISYVGMVTQEVPVSPVVNVTLKDDSELLDEVIVTGYGTFKKSSFTGAASNLSTEKLQDVPAISISDKLAGGVAGVQITSTSGQPGAVESVRIRGMGSINASNEPLYVIDGVPMTTGDASGFGYSQGGSSLLSTINSNDIESITVVKDAAAASLYGSRAANGVIVITTKKGKAGKTIFNLRSDWGFSDMAVNYRPVLSGADRRELLHHGLVNYATNVEGLTGDNAIGFADRNIDAFAAEPWSGYTDWKDVLFRKGSHQNYEFSAQGGNDKTKFYASLAYTEQKGLTNNSGYERFTGNGSVSHDAGRVKFDFSTFFTKTNQDQISEGTSFASPIMVAAMTASPSTFPYNEDGSYSNVFPALNGANILQTMEHNYDKNTVNRALNTVSATWNIWDNLNLKEVLNYDFNQADNRVWWDPRSNDGRSSNGVFQRYMINRNKLTTQTQLTYDKRFADHHNIDALLGFETEDYKLDYVYANGSDYPGYLPEITNAATTRSSSQIDKYRMTSMLGRLNYDYQSKYYVSGSFRRDGSSRLAQTARWGNFWSVSGSWRLSEESFMESADIISDAKVRASYGLNGTQPSSYYQYMGVYSYGYNYNGKPGSTETRLLNPDLKWEKNHATNIGFDVTLANRFSIAFDWYNRDTKDLLLDQPISHTTGLTSILKNVGSIRNRGFEVELRSTNMDRGDFFWTTTLNLAHNKNKLLKLDGEQDEMTGSFSFIKHKVGEPFFSYYMYEYAGVDPATGKESFYINDGSENSRATTTNVSEAENVIVGNSEPVLTGGLTNFFSWKWIDFNMTFTYSLGGYAYDSATWLQSNGGTYHYHGNVPAYNKVEDMWQKEGDNAKLPQFAYSNQNNISSRWMKSTDHLRLKNLTLGFTVPQAQTTKLGLSKVRAYVSANNLLTFKSSSLDFDPEVPVDGVVTFETPALKTVAFGLQVTF